MSINKKKPEDAIVYRGDVYGFGIPVGSESVAFMRITKSGNIFHPQLDMKDGTMVKFTKGEFEGTIATFVLSRKNWDSRFKWSQTAQTRAKTWYPFKKNKGREIDPTTIEFEILRFVYSIDPGKRPE